MKVLVVVRQPHPNLCGIVHGLKQSGYAVGVAAFSSRKGCDELDGLKPCYLNYSVWSKYIYSGKNRHIYGIPSLRSLFFIFFTFKPNIIILRTFRRPYLLISTIGLIFRIKIVFLSAKEKYLKDQGEINLYERLRSSIVRFFSYLKLAPTAIIFATEDLTSGGSKTWMMPGVSYAWACYPVLPGVRSRFDDFDSKSKFRILVVTGFNNQRKQPWLIIEALEYMNYRDKVSIYFVGFGTENSDGARKVVGAAEKIGFNSYEVSYNFSMDEVKSYMDTCDLLVSPAKNERFGMIVPEALSMGLPVVCSDTFGARCYVEKSGAGTIFRTDDAIDLAHKIDSIVGDSERLQEMKKRALEYAELELRPSAWVRKFEMLIRDEKKS